MDDPISLNSGDRAPFSGLLFSEQKANQIRADLLEADKSKLLLETEKHRTQRLTQTIALKDEEIELYSEQNKRLINYSRRSDTLNYVWFGLGVFVTGLAVYGAGALSR